MHIRFWFTPKSKHTSKVAPIELIDIAEAFLKQDTYNRILYSLGAFYARLPDDGESLLKIPQKDIWREKGGRSISLHRDVIKGNNGIKIENLCRMLIPIGLDVRNIDGILLVELDQFGAIRGSMAHSSLRVRRGAMVDPFVKEAEIKRLITLLQDFDRDFHQFVKSQM